MTRRPIVHTLSLFCTMLVLSGAASAEVVQCTSETGAVTYTDAPCVADEGIVRVIGSIDPSSSRAGILPLADGFSSAEKARKTASALKSFPRRRLEQDIATIKAARTSMLLMDNASALARQQRLAQL